MVVALTPYPRTRRAHNARTRTHTAHAHAPTHTHTDRGALKAASLARQKRMISSSVTDSDPGLQSGRCTHTSASYVSTRATRSPRGTHPQTIEAHAHKYLRTKGAGHNDGQSGLRSHRTRIGCTHASTARRAAQTRGEARAPKHCDARRGECSGAREHEKTRTREAIENLQLIFSRSCAQRRMQRGAALRSASRSAPARRRECETPRQTLQYAS